MRPQKEHRKKTLLFFTYIAVILLILITPQISGFDGRPWIDENGNLTDLININPDPSGEPWIVGGIKPPTEEERRYMDSVPELEIPPNLRNRSLPAEVLLIKNEEFPSIISQIGGSCVQASSVGYAYAYQLNVLKGVTSSPSNNRAYGFTHNFLNRGDKEKGSTLHGGFEILKKLGAPSIKTFHDAHNGGLYGSRWMNGADRWHTANDNRVLSYQRIKINTLEDIQKIKSWMYDLNGADPHKKGGCVLFSAEGQTAKPNSVVSSGPYAGEKLCTQLDGFLHNHGMTFAGYSDNVEGGSLLLVNTYGKSFGTNGYVWVPYTTVVNGGLSDNEVWCVTVGLIDPVFELRATVTHEERNQMQLLTGFANGNAERPTVMKTYGEAFNYSGGKLRMEGLEASSTIEVSLDASEFLDDLSGDDATFFLKVTNKSGTCKIDNLTLIDFSGDTPVEYPAAETNVSISANETRFIPITYRSKVPRYVLTATAHGNGTISPKGVVKVNSGTDKSYSMTPDHFHKIDSVVVDGDNVGSNFTYTFTNITTNHTIDVYFGWDPETPDLYTIKSTNKKNGSISPTDSLVIAKGSDTTITITPFQWYHVDSVLIDGKNRGPLISAHFTNLRANHTIEPFFSTRNYGLKYPAWASDKAFNKDDIVNYNGHLWKAKYWTKKRPGGSNSDWIDMGEILSPEDDTLTIAFLDYISNPELADTLIITTKKIFKGDTTTVIDTITDKVSKEITQKIANKVYGYFLPTGSQFYAPQKGVYTVTLFDVRGRLIKQIKIHAHQRGIKHIPVKEFAISNGTYLMQLTGKNTNLIRRFIF